MYRDPQTVQAISGWSSWFRCTTRPCRQKCHPRPTQEQVPPSMPRLHPRSRAYLHAWSLPVSRRIGRANMQNRVGGGLTPAALPHHRTCGSASGGSTDTLQTSLLTQQRDQPHACEEDRRQGLVQVRRPGVPPRTTTIASAASSTLSVQPPLT